MALDLGVSRKWCGPAAIESQSCSPQETQSARIHKAGSQQEMCGCAPRFESSEGKSYREGGVAQGPREGATATARGITEGLGGMRQRGWPG